MARTLIAGCSFLSTLACNNSENSWFLDHSKFRIAATAGSGNQAISARTIWEYAQDPPSEIIVIWTGINRLDAPISPSVQNTFPCDGDPSHRRWLYSFNTNTDSISWYHSGGQAGSWIWDANCPKSIHDWFKLQYLGDDPRYLNDLSLLAIINLQTFLKANDVSYRMAFAYDIFKDKHQHEHCFGKVDTGSVYYPLIDWDRITINQPLFEWAHQDPNRISSDTFHPSREAVKEWFDLTFGVDLSI